MRVGFVGLGSQGAPMAQRIVAAGLDLTVWARRQETLDPFRSTSATIADSLAELGKGVDLLEICVFDGAGANEVLFGPNGAAHTMAPGSIIAVHSTVAPAEVIELAARAAELDLRVLDAPVSGGAPKAEAGELVTMIGGPAEALEQCRPVFSTFADPIIHLGDVGAGQQAKLINNAMLVAHVAVAADGFDIAEQLGLDRAGLAEVLRLGSGRSFGAEMAARMGSVQQMAATPAGPTLSKDVRLLSELVAGASAGAAAGGSQPILLPVAQSLIAQWDALEGAS